MIYSLSEIDAQCKKAARGAHLQWGYAEEVGKAARWLTSHLLPGVPLLAAYLNQRDKNPEQYKMPKADGETLSAPCDALLCPLLTGAFICDRGTKSTRIRFVLRQLAYPLLLLPYLAQLSLINQVAVKLTWQGVDLYCGAGRLKCIESNNLTATRVDEAFCKPTPITHQGKMPAAGSQYIDKQSWQVLTKLAHRTYIPASETSRQAAGPAIIDG